MSCMIYGRLSSVLLFLLSFIPRLLLLLLFCLPLPAWFIFFFLTLHLLSYVHYCCAGGTGVLYSDWDYDLYVINRKI